MELSIYVSIVVDGKQAEVYIEGDILGDAGAFHCNIKTDPAIDPDQKVLEFITQTIGKLYGLQSVTLLKSEP